MSSILLLNGPNLNMLGLREPHIYGAETLAQVEKRAHDCADRLGMTLDARQSNHEGELVTWIQQARGVQDAIILNAGAYTHTSVAIHDALKACDTLVIELHISNPLNREAFRHRSFVAPAASMVIAGFGTLGYEMAINAAARRLANA